MFNKKLYHNLQKYICHISGFLAQIKFSIVSIVFHEQNCFLSIENLAANFAGRKMVQTFRNKVLDIVSSNTVILHSLNDAERVTNKYIWKNLDQGENFLLSSKSYYDASRLINKDEREFFLRSIVLLGGSGPSTEVVDKKVMWEGIDIVVHQERSKSLELVDS